MAFALTFGLQIVIFSLVTVPYVISVLYWFLFYRMYPQDAVAQQAHKAAQASTYR